MSDGTPDARALSPDPAIVVEMATEIVAAYVRNNSLPVGDVPALLRSVHGALVGLGAPEPVAAAPEKPTPPVPIRKTVADDHIISLEDGKRYKTLKRHLARMGLTPEAYRAKWGLPHDYPMAAPAYSRARSAMAKEMGLGAMRRKR